MDGLQYSVHPERTDLMGIEWLIKMQHEIELDWNIFSGMYVKWVDDNNCEFDNTTYTSNAEEKRGNVSLSQELTRTIFGENFQVNVFIVRIRP